MYPQETSSTTYYELGNSPSTKPTLSWNLSIPGNDQACSKQLQTLPRRTTFCPSPSTYMNQQTKRVYCYELGSHPFTKPMQTWDLSIPGEQTSSPKKRCAPPSEEYSPVYRKKLRMVCDDDSPNPSEDEEEPSSQDLIQQNQYDVLLHRALDSHASMTIIRYLLGMNAKHNLLGKRCTEYKKRAMTPLEHLLSLVLFKVEYVQAIQMVVQHDSTLAVSEEAKDAIMTFLCRSRINSAQKEATALSILGFFEDADSQFFASKKFIHLVLTFQPHCTKLIQFFLKVTPDTLYTKNGKGQYPLHIAMMKLHSSVPLLLDIIQKSLQGPHNPNEMLCKDVNGYTPLDLAWINRPEPPKFFSGSEEQEQLFYNELLDKALEQIMEMSSTGPENVEQVLGSTFYKILLHVVHHAHPNLSCVHAASALNSISAPILQIFMLLYPNQVHQPDSVGKLPIHYVRRNKAKLEILLKFYPEGIAIKDSSRKLPLHCALEGGDVDIISEMIRVYPESVEDRDPSTRLFPFMQAALMDGKDVKLIYSLLRMSPSLISS